ncbi:hypothetical protein Hanom_Chr12g01131961 [Helianthus anomalus]
MVMMTNGGGGGSSKRLLEKNWRSEWRWLRVEFAAVVFERGGGERWWSNQMWAGPQ